MKRNQIVKSLVLTIMLFVAFSATQNANAQGRHGVRDRVEDVRDRRENVRDRREDVRDRREDVRDRRENRRDRRF